MYVGKVGLTMRPVVLIPMTLLPSSLLSAKISLGDIPFWCLSLLESRLHALGEQKEGREEDERAFLGVSFFFFFSSSQQGGEGGGEQRFSINSCPSREYHVL